jgi:plasmid stability protein
MDIDRLGGGEDHGCYQCYHCDEREVPCMAQLIVRNLDEAIVRRLKEIAAQHGRSAEAEHREILRQVLLGDGDEAPPMKDLLLDMPDVGTDADFERPRDLGRDLPW